MLWGGGLWPCDHHDLLSQQSRNRENLLLAIGRFPLAAGHCVGSAHACTLDTIGTFANKYAAARCQGLAEERPHICVHSATTGSYKPLGWDVCRKTGVAFLLEMSWKTRSLHWAFYTYRQVNWAMGEWQEAWYIQLWGPASKVNLSIWVPWSERFSKESASIFKNLPQKILKKLSVDELLPKFKLILK